MLRGPLFSRSGAIAAGVALLLIFLGCMSFEGSHVDRTEVVSPPEVPNPYLVGDGLLEQEGRGAIRGLAEEDVYYPVPYISPPNLELEGDPEFVRLVYQRRDHFRIKNWCNNTHYVGSFHWKARGVKILVTAPPPPGPNSNLPTPRTLPQEPVPVSQP